MPVPGGFLDFNAQAVGGLYEWGTVRKPDDGFAGRRKRCLPGSVDGSIAAFGLKEADFGNCGQITFA